MGNDQSKREEKDDPSRNATRQERSLPELATRPVKTLVSRALPVDPRWYDTPDTPTSDVSFTDSDFERDDALNSEVSRLRSYDPHASHVEESDDDEAPHSQTLEQFLHRFVHGHEAFQLLVGHLEYPCIEKLTCLAKAIGFESCIFEMPYVRLCRGKETVGTTPEMRTEAGKRGIEKGRSLLEGMGQVDAVMEESLTKYLKQALHFRGKSPEPSASSVLIEFDVESFLLPVESVKKIFHRVAVDCHVHVQLSHQRRIALVGDEKTERAIQKGELVWRRLQHWSTNVRKEKKFNIWAKGLAEEVKERILTIALEIGFETAVIQQNGNIHLEIKPPEGQHRRKLKHATDELRKELEPIDEAVCQNVEQHLKEWLSNFHKNGKQKDVLNCRFVLPAEWLRQTSVKLAAQYGLSVSMETGIELLFYRSDLDPALIQEPQSSAKDPNPPKKTKSKNRTKKKSPEPSVKSEHQSTNGVEPHVPLMQFDPRTTMTVTPPVLAAVPPPPVAMGTAVRRPVGRNKTYDYGWDPSWPTAHPDRATTSQHTY